MRILDAKQAEETYRALPHPPAGGWGLKYLDVSPWQRDRDIRCACGRLLMDTPAVILALVRDGADAETVALLLPDEGESPGLDWWDSEDVEFEAFRIFEEALDRMETEEWNDCPRVIVRTDSGALRQLDLSPYGFPERDFWSCIECYDDDHGTHLCELDGDDFLGRDVGDDYVPLDPSEVA